MRVIEVTLGQGFVELYAAKRRQSREAEGIFLLINMKPRLNTRQSMKEKQLELELIQHRLHPFDFYMESVDSVSSKT